MCNVLSLRRRHPDKNQGSTEATHMMQQLNAAKDKLGQEYSGALLHHKAQLQQIVVATSFNTCMCGHEEAACCWLRRQLLIRMQFLGITRSSSSSIGRQ
jgi:hypothetical protein